MTKSKFTQHRPLFAKPQPARKSSRVKAIFPAVWRIAKRGFMLIGIMVVLSSVVSAFTISQLFKNDAPTKTLSDSVLSIKLEDALYETSDEADFYDPFAPMPMTLRDVTEAIDRAANDDNIEGLIMRLESAPISLAQAMEIRAALTRFRQAEKFTKIYSSSYGGAGGGLVRYYLASVFDEIWMQPMGIVSIPGIEIEIPFLRDVLDTVGVKPEFFQREKYKSAYENLMRSEMSDANREALTALVGDLREEIVAKLAISRGVRPAQFEKYIEKGLFTSTEAFEAGLISHPSYADQMIEAVKEELTGDPDSEDVNFVSIQSYVNNHRMSGFESGAASRKPQVALVYVSGAIMQSADSGGNIAASEDVAPEIMKAARDEDIEAIVIRIDSPGGSPTASESILRAIQYAKNKGKTVTVSMGSMAASGGYWIASGADRIFALPITLTGSIGVIGGKFDLSGLWNKVGVNWDDSVSWGENAGMFSMNKGFSNSGSERYNAMLDHTYDSFLERVAKGRNMTIEQVREIAQGRVWSGKRALDLGLVDELGDLNDTLNYVAVQIGEESKNDLAVIVLPEPQTPFENILDLLGGQVSAGKSLVRLQHSLEPFMAVSDGVLNRSADMTVYDPVEIGF
jgi:protease-4